MFRTSFICLLVSLSFLLAPWPAAAGTIEEGIGLYEAGKFGQAETVLRGLSSAEPKNLRARYYLGLTLLELEKYKEAEAEFAEAERILVKSEDPAGATAPRLDQVKVGLARSYMEEKEFDGAQASLDEALSLRSDNPEIFLYRGKLELHRERYPQAAKELDKAIAIDPKNAYAHYYAGIAYSNIKRPDKMVDHFQMFLKLAPEAPESKKVRSLLRSVR